MLLSGARWRHVDPPHAPALLGPPDERPDHAELESLRQQLGALVGPAAVGVHLDANVVGRTLALPEPTLQFRELVDVGDKVVGRVDLLRG